MASAADFAPQPYLAPAPVAVPVLPYDRFELRFGAFGHGIGGREENTVDLNFEFATPRLPLGVTGWLGYLVPRIHAGFSGNLGNRTSYVYAGALWTIPIWDRLSGEIFVGPAVHDGSYAPTQRLSGLGCPVLFHTGVSLAYQLTDRWSVIGTVSHLSNGRELFGISCGSNQVRGGNQGLNNVGLRVGYSF